MPPAWVRKRDGRLEPFDADKISRALFAASEALGRPDAFLARELTDGVVHFLTEEADDALPRQIRSPNWPLKWCASWASRPSRPPSRNMACGASRDAEAGARSADARGPRRRWTRCCRPAPAPTRCKPCSPATSSPPTPTAC